jgi:hypothetical protein
MQDLEQTIRERAYQLWVSDGFRDGNAETHWLIAQREILASSLGNFARVTISQPPPAMSKKQGKLAGNAAVARKQHRAV